MSNDKKRSKFYVNVEGTRILRDPQSPTPNQSLPSPSLNNNNGFNISSNSSFAVAASSVYKFIQAKDKGQVNGSRSKITKRDIGSPKEFRHIDGFGLNVGKHQQIRSFDIEVIEDGIPPPLSSILGASSSFDLDRTSPSTVLKRSISDPNDDNDQFGNSKLGQEHFFKPREGQLCRPTSVSLPELQVSFPEEVVSPPGCHELRPEPPILHAIALNKDEVEATSPIPKPDGERNFGSSSNFTPSPRQRLATRPKFSPPPVPSSPALEPLSSRVPGGKVNHSYIK